MTSKAKKPAPDSKVNFVQIAVGLSDQQGRTIIAL